MYYSHDQMYVLCYVRMNQGPRLAYLLVRVIGQRGGLLGGCGLDRVGLCDDGDDGGAALNMPQELDVDALRTAR
jgi:hypothetical protein